jgi:uncharacterized protein YbjT (DUF2867 family)
MGKYFRAEGVPLDPALTHVCVRRKWAQGVRLVRREDERAEALRRLVQGDLTDLLSMHLAIEGCRRV